MKQTTKFNISVMAVAIIATLMIASVGLSFDEADAKKKKGKDKKDAEAAAS